MGEWIRKARIESGLRQTDLAETLGVCVESVQRWESERLRAGPRRLRGLTEILGVPTLAR